MNKVTSHGFLWTSGDETKKKHLLIWVQLVSKSSFFVDLLSSLDFQLEIDAFVLYSALFSLLKAMIFGGKSWFFQILCRKG